MTGMSIQRRLLLIFLVVSFLLGLYILRVSFKIQVPWRMKLEPFPGFSYSGQKILTPPFSPMKLTADTGQTHGSATKTAVLKAQSNQTVLPDQSSTKLQPGTQPGQDSTKPQLGTIPVQSNTKPLPGTQPGQSSTTPRSRETATYSEKADTRSTRGHRPNPHLPTSLPMTTEPSFIGDNYAKEDTPKYTECPDSIRSRVWNTKFGKRFLSDIPKLQWTKDATEEQYKRLQQYPMPHGWNGLDFQTLVDSLSVLNTKANHQMFDDWASRANRSRCIHCAVVGNGGILKGSKKGQEIDQHDYIFRTNGAITKGFEEDVGWRTSFYIFSTNTMRNSMAAYAKQGYRGPPKHEETRYVFLPDQDRDYLLMKAAATNTTVERGREKNQTPSIYFGKNVTVEKLKMYHPDFIRYLRNRYLRSHTLNTKYKNIYRPSTGAVMLLAAIHTCDEVSAYGFITPNYKNYSDHYFDSIYHPVGFYVNHDMRMELSLWQDLHQAKLIQLYMRP